MSDSLTTASAQAFLEANFAPWVLALRPQVTRIDAGGASLTIPITEDIQRSGGIVSGQTLASLADTVMVIACSGAVGELIAVGTVTLDTQFLRPARGDGIEARAEIVKAGRGMIFARCTLAAHPGGEIVATATATFAR